MTAASAGPDGDLEAPIDHRELCLRVRFSLDEPMPHSDELRKRREEGSLDRITRSRGEAVRVTARLMPDLHRAVEDSARRLMLASPPEVWVRASPHLNAVACIEGERSIVILQSALVELLSPEEIATVIGHEFAHITLDHLLPLDEDGPGAEYLLALDRRRAAEVSCDRVGLLAAPDLATAIRAELKLATGLGDRHLRLDVNSLLEHLSTNPEEVDADWEALSTHPAMAFRFWSLLRFSESDLYSRLTGRSGGRSFGEVEREIEDRFFAAGGGTAFRTASELMHRSLAWLAVLMVAEDQEVNELERRTLVAFVGRVWADDATAYARRHGLKAVERRAEESLRPLSHAGSWLRKRLEDSLREFADVCADEGRKERVLKLFHASIKGE
jgi:hypothetical protein